MPPRQPATGGRVRPGTTKSTSATTSSRATTLGGKRGASSAAGATSEKNDKFGPSRGKKQQQQQQQRRQRQQRDDDEDEGGQGGPEVVTLDDYDDELGGGMDVDEGAMDTRGNEVEDKVEEEEEEEEEEMPTIPPELLTRILHEFFEKEETRITRDANAAVARYVDVFVREAIARAAVESGREGGFLEVEDLEKIAPQLLMDL